MSHDHEHEHGHSHQIDLTSINRRAFYIGIILNSGFVIVEIIAGIYYNSMALLTDAGHNLSDVASLVLSALAFWAAGRKSSSRYTYGYKKTTILAALSNAVLLLIAIGILGYESISRLLKPVAVDGTPIAWIAALGIVVNTVSALLFYKIQSKELNARSAYLHLLADALVSVGVVVAGIIIQRTGWYWLDPVIGIVIMVIIFFGTWGLLKNSFNMTIDAVPSDIKLEEVKTLIGKQPNVERVEHVHIWPLSTMENALTAQVLIAEALSFEEKMKVVKEIKHQLEHNNIQHSTIELL